MSDIPWAAPAEFRWIRPQVVDGGMEGKIAGSIDSLYGLVEHAADFCPRGFKDAVIELCGGSRRWEGDDIEALRRNLPKS